MRSIFIGASFLVLALNGLIYLVWPPVLWSLILFGPLILVGFRDMAQTRHSVLRNFPVVGHMRYFLELISPEIRQYFIESDTSGAPFNRQERSVVYERAKNVRDTVPFGTVRDVYATGYEWVNHSLSPKHLDLEEVRVLVGGKDCKQPYNASLLNISAMSYGALSQNAVIALNKGAKMGNFAHNTGEGSISPYHLQGGDLIWQVGTGYFGCRTDEGKFNPDMFKEKSALEEVKMIEIKLSQGAKPGHGGILPAAKLTEEIASIRSVPMGKDVNSPPGHTAFSNPTEFMHFIQLLRELSGGKPIGFKLCVGKRREFLSICKAMLKTGITPDFITVDGGEGGTGAAPLEFTNRIGTPLVEGLIFVHNSLVGFDLRKEMRICTSGKITTGFDIIKRLAMGADLCYSARGMMMSLGCIQALKCNTNTCPVGVTTQDPRLVVGLVPEDKCKRVYNFQKNIIKSACEMMGAMGLEKTDDLKPWHLMRRTEAYEIRNYSEIYDFLKPGDLLKKSLPVSYARAVEAANAESFNDIHPSV